MTVTKIGHFLISPCFLNLNGIEFQVNRRYADPKIEANTKGPMKFEGDSFWHVPYDTDLISFF